jgi:hypothetical protein
VEIIDRIGRNRIVSLLIAVTAFAAVAYCVQYLRSYPQMEADEEVFKTVDALFTALNSKNIQRLNDCEQRLRKYSDEGNLASSASRNLEGIIERARAGEWENSSQTLYDFILAQRRTN